MRIGIVPGMYPVLTGNNGGKKRMTTGKSLAIDNLKAVAQAYCDAAGVPPKTLSWRVFNDGKKLDAILADKADLMTAGCERAMAWLSANWPEGAIWPTEVPRPVLQLASETMVTE